MSDRVGDSDWPFSDDADGSAAHQRCRTLMRAIDDGITVVDETGKTTFANERAEEILGGPREPLVEFFPDSFDRDFVDETGEPLETDEVPSNRVVDREEPVYDEIIGLRRPSGERVWVSVNGVPQWDVSDGFDGAVFVFEDVTEQRDAESELEEILGRVSDAFCTFDGEFRFTYVNDRAEELLQASEDELLGEVPWQLYPEATEIDGIWQTFHTAMETQEPQSYEHYFEPLEFWVDVTVYPSETGLSIYFQEITERKESESQREAMFRTIRENEERLRLALEAGEMGTWELDLQTEDSPVRSPQHDRIFGYEEPLDDWGLEIFLEHVHPDDRGRVEQRFENAFETGTWEFECRIIRADGGRRWIAAQGEFYFDEGEPVRAVGIVQDVTERREYQQKLEKSNKRLERFAYAASHDLQEPLRMVTSYLQLIEGRYDDELDDDGREFIEFAVDGAERMRKMINSLLEYSRVETQGDQFEPIDLDDVIVDVREDLQIQIEETDVEITTRELPCIQGDVSQVRLVFQNLISNAITYSDDSSPRIHIGADRQGQRWVLSIQDDGVGIESDDQERIFDVFERVHTNEEYEGTGIGLALCERIVERHSGEIWVESEPGEGSTFSFTLPTANSCPG
jgi:PAS domain S-box-containing protein